MVNLNSIREQLSAFVLQAGPITCQIEHFGSSGEIALDAAGTVTLTGCAQEVYSSGASMATLSLTDLARLAEVAAKELSLTHQQRAERDQRQRDEALYAQRKIAANHFAFSDEVLCPSGYSIEAAEMWLNVNTAHWEKYVSLYHAGTGGLIGKLVVDFTDATADVISAELKLKDGTILGQYRATEAPVIL